MVRAFVRGRCGSIGCAMRGIGLLVKREKNAWVHLGATMVVVAVSLGLRLSREEWCWMVAAIGGVWVAEALNTAVERVCDAVCPEVNPLIGRAKDVAAGGVLMAAMGAAVIGVLVLGPHVWVLVAAR
jgi:diacylglycerol kinase (ATP)